MNNPASTNPYLGCWIDCLASYYGLATIMLYSRMLSIHRHTMLIGCLFLSIPAMASVASAGQMSDDLAKANQNHTAREIFVKSDAVADAIGKYLPSARTAMECREKSKNDGGSCKQVKACLPDIQFLKINPTKYRVRVFHACQSFNLVFSERFDPLWKSYIVKTSDKLEKEYLKYDKVKTNIPPNSPTIIEPPYITTENHDFPEHQIWETWLSGESQAESGNIPGIGKSRNRQILEPSRWRYIEGFNDASVKWPDSLHSKANTFANSWFFDLQGVQGLSRTLHNQVGYYIRNPDGSVNFEVVIEYWPQRLLYLAYVISAFSIFLCLAAVIYMKFRKSNS